jgi:hypothetical protein
MSCGASTTRGRPDVARRAELAGFVGWLLGRDPQAVLDGGTGRTFRHRHAWCWRVEPTVVVTGEVHDQVQLDGIYLRGGWCCLIASTPTGVVDWQWCDREKTVAWEALLGRVPPPGAVISDGGAGLAAALKKCWPETRVQRCLVHVQRNCRTYLTSHPRTAAGKALWGLARRLTRVEDVL